MEKIVIDSHALFWFLAKNPKLSKKAKQAIEDAEQIIVPSIVLMEMLFIFEKYDVAHNTISH
jgi:PIN domain nuclease of toxin-antitoxin system